MQRTRNGETTREDLQGGTFTITNIGRLGGRGFTPIINYPQVAILGMARASWLSRWQLGHSTVAIETQSIFGYTQNAVVRSLTPDAPELAGIVEELFPAEAITDLKAFFGAADDADLQQRLSRMVASTSAFGANENIDTVPTSRYVLKTPFQT